MPNQIYDVFKISLEIFLKPQGFFSGIQKGFQKSKLNAEFKAVEILQKGLQK
jgi:hypothetical protein